MKTVIITIIIMFVERVLWVAWLVCRCQGSNQTIKDIFTPNLRSQLQKFCPMNEYDSCGVTTFARANDLDSCCQECSCRDNCHQFGSCCFPHDVAIDHKRFSSRPGQECIPLEFGKIFQGLHESKYFIVVTSCGENHPAFSASEIDCGDINVAVWGSLFPVYSPTSRKIYKNAECARCNNVTDTIAWKPFLSCKMEMIVRIDDYLEWLENGEFPENCYMRFVFPLSSSLVSTESCHPYKRVVDYCEQSPESEAYKKYHAACMSGFLSPFIGLKSIIYENVFCALCSQYVLDESNVCTIVFIPKIIRGSFSCILTYSGSSRWQASGYIQLPLTTTAPMACRQINPKKNQSKDCVPVFCPTGQIYTDTFQCIHPIKHWMVKGYEVYLRISLGFETDLERLAKVKFGRTLSIKSNWPSKWQIDEIKLEINSKYSAANATVSNIRVGLKRFNMGKLVEYSKILDEIKEHVSDKWTITTPHFNAIGSAAFCSKHLPSLEAYIPEVEIPVFDNGIDESMIGSISKMHFCRRVLLNEDEYQIDEFNVLKYGNKTFEYQDYDTFDIPNKHKIGVRVCIEDSEYTIVSSGSSSVFFTDSILFRITVCVILAVLMTLRMSYLRYTRKQREVT